MVFTIPMVIGNLAQQLYNTADSIIVGRYVGDKALAAVGTSFPVINLLTVLLIGISTGVSIMVSQYFGAKEKEKLATAIGNGMVVSFAASLFLMVFAPPAIGWLLRLLHTPESIFAWSRSYLLIMAWGIGGMIFYNILSGVLRGLGDSFSALLYLLVATLLNIALDILFVARFSMGVAGVALATVIAQAVSSVLCLIKIFRMKGIFELRGRHFSIDAGELKTMMRLGLPPAFTHAIISLAMITVQALTNRFGELFIAASIIVMRVDGFAMLPNFSFGTAMTTYTGQNVGARRFDRVMLGAKQGAVLSLITSGSITVAVLLFGRYLMGIFTETEELVDLGMRLMKIIALGYIAMGISQCMFGVMRGAGDSLTPMWISLFTTVVVRVPVAYGLAYLTRSPQYPIGRQESVYISLLCSWTLGAVISAVIYKMGHWKKKAFTSLPAGDAHS